MLDASLTSSGGIVRREEGRGRAAPSFLDLPVALADAAIVLAWLRGDLTSPDAIAAHAIAVLVVAAVAALALRAVTPRLVCLLLMLLLLGPLGGAAWMVQRRLPLGSGARLAGRAAEEPAHGGTGRAVLLHAEIRQGRRPVPRLGELASYADVFASGDPESRNAALAAISRKYRPELLPALMAALNAEVPAVRVQAAAVYAKLRTQFSDRAKALLAATPGPVPAENSARARECRETARCGLLDSVVAARLDALADRLEAEAEARREAERHPTRRVRGFLVETFARSGWGAPAPASPPLPRPVPVHVRSLAGDTP